MAASGLAVLSAQWRRAGSNTTSSWLGACKYQVHVNVNTAPDNTAQRSAHVLCVSISLYIYADTRSEAIASALIGSAPVVAVMCV
jgi:hypothetical protein